MASINSSFNKQKLSEPDVSSPPNSFVAIANTGCTGHYISSTIPFINQEPTRNSNSVQVPNGSTMQSTHTVQLNLPNCSPHACQAHLFPGMTASLISISQLCNDGCTAIFTDTSVNILKGSRVIMSGNRTREKLWTLDIQRQIGSPATSTNYALSMY
jgi:hypothetical protein